MLCKGLEAYVEIAKPSFEGDDGRNRHDAQSLQWSLARENSDGQMRLRNMSTSSGLVCSGRMRRGEIIRNSSDWNWSFADELPKIGLVKSGLGLGLALPTSPPSHHSNQDSRLTQQFIRNLYHYLEFVSLRFPSLSSVATMSAVLEATSQHQPQTKKFGKSERTVPHKSQKASKWYPAEDQKQPKKVCVLSSTAVQVPELSVCEDIMGTFMPLTQLLL
jgi:hypothetical protein